MSMEQTMAEQIHHGGCLCGGVRYETRADLRPVIYCHCGQCQKTSGNFVAATFCERSDLDLSASESLTWYRASDTARRGFCNVCGGNVFWEPDADSYIAIFAGTLDAPSGLTAESHIFVSSKADYVTLNDGLPQYPENDD